MTRRLPRPGAVFADGGITALGTNIDLMGLVDRRRSATASSVCSCAVLPKRLAHGRRRPPPSARWCRCRPPRSASSGSTPSAAPRRVPLGAVAAAMVGWHVLIGIGEAVITGARGRQRRRRPPRPRVRRPPGLRRAAHARASATAGAPRARPPASAPARSVLIAAARRPRCSPAWSSYYASSQPRRPRPGRRATRASPTRPDEARRPAAARSPATASRASTTPGCPAGSPGVVGVVVVLAARRRRHARRRRRGGDVADEPRRATTASADVGAGHGAPAALPRALAGAPGCPPHAQARRPGRLHAASWSRRPRRGGSAFVALPAACWSRVVAVSRVPPAYLLPAAGRRGAVRGLRAC